MINYIMVRNNVSFKEACELLSDGRDLPTIDLRFQQNRAKPKPFVNPGYSAPAADWQVSAKQIIEDCQKTLWQFPKPLDYLRERGLSDSSIRSFRLGYNPRSQDLYGLYVPRGITIPCVVNDVVWYIKTRDDAARDKSKRYRGIQGNKTAAIFGADICGTSGTIFFAEGEFNAMILNQESLYPAMSFGSAQTLPDLATWGMYFLGVKKIYAIYDDDDAGRQGLDKIKHLVGDKVTALTTPMGYDINDLFVHGWLEHWLENQGIIDAVKPSQVAQLLDWYKEDPVAAEEFYQSQRKLYLSTLKEGA